MKKTEPKLSVKIEDGRVVYQAPAGGFHAEFTGADFPQLVDDGLRVHTPLTDCTAVLSFRLIKESEITEVDVPLFLKGQFGAPQKKPRVLPEPAQWHGMGNGVLQNATGIVCTDEELRFAAENFAREMSLICKKEIPLSENGNIRIMRDEAVSYLGKEGYEIICDKGGVSVSVSDALGAIWAGKTVCQLMGQGGFPYGTMRDYPRYPVRGFMLDVGRRPVSMDTLDAVADAMAWYKLNDFQVHLSDNYIWLEDYAEKGDESTFAAYEAFRLESGVTNANGETATAKDYFYTKDEFRAFIERSAKKGVRIIPEIDMPAHALSFTKVFPEHAVKNETSSIMKTRPLTDHLNVAKPETVEFIKTLFDDYTKGENPVFPTGTPVHIGADEFLSDYGAYRRFINEFVPYIKETNPVRLWGGLTWIKDEPETKIVREAIDGVQMNLWACNWADGKEMYDMGYELINTIDAHLYMVPNGSEKRGSYGDYLPKKKTFAEFEPGRVRLKNNKYFDLPAGSRRVLGAAYAIWNDNIDKRASGLRETDLFDRFMDSAALMAEKTWGSCTEKKNAKQLDNAARTVGYAPKKTEKPFAGVQNIELHGGADFTETDTVFIPVGKRVKIDIKFREVKAGQILTEADCAYGTYDLRITENGKLGFTVEGYAYEFDYTPPVGERVTLLLDTKPLHTVLKLGLLRKKKAVGSYTFNGVTRKTGIENATFAVPAMRIGSKTNAVNATVYSIEVL